MPKDTFYFSHDYNARNDEKIKRLIRKHGMQGYGVFWAIIEDLYNNSNQLMLDCEGIAFDLRIDLQIVTSVLNDFDLFVIDGNVFGSKSIENRIQARSEKSNKARTSALSKWGSNKENQTKRSERLSEARRKGTHTKEQWEEMKLFFGECVKCGNTHELVKDHIIPIYQGGSDALSNLQPLCKSCNSSKGADTTDYRITYCDNKACEMPATYFETPAIKEIKGKEIKEIKENKDIPTLDVFLSFCLQETASAGLPWTAYEYPIKAKYESWVSNGWKDGHNKPIKNWKSKVKNTLPFLAPIKNSGSQNNSYQKQLDDAIKAYKPVQS